MSVKRFIYNIVSVLLLILTVILLATVDSSNSINVSIIVQIVLILYIFKITYGCFMYIKEQYLKQKYSYSIIMNLGLALFLIVNLVRQILLLINNFNEITINDIYNNTLESFSFFAILILPFIVILAIYSVITNIILIIKEGFRPNNLLGIFFGIFVLIGALASQIAFEITKNIKFSDSQILIKKFIDLSLNAVLCYFYCITLATLYCNIMAAKHNPSYDKDFVIVLGSKIRKDGTLTPLLKARVDRAIKFAKEQKDKTSKDIIFVTSGGKGEDEVISESEAMHNYLIENGIDSKQIIIENKSTNTAQNMQFSKEKIDDINKEGKIIFSTTNYHVFRSGVIANEKGIDCEGIGSSTKWYFYVNALLREFLANLFSQKKQHFVLITSINIALFVLVIIGYKYNLI